MEVEDVGYPKRNTKHNTQDADPKGEMLVIPTIRVSVSTVHGSMQTS